MSPWIRACGSVILAACVSVSSANSQMVAAERPAGVHPSAVFSRVVTVDIERRTVKEALDLLAERANIRVMYQASRLDRASGLVTLRAHDLPLGIAFERVLQGTGFRADAVTPEVVNIVPVDGSMASMVQGSIVGRVIDAKTRQGLRGAMILLSGTSNMKREATSGDAGAFRLGDIGPGTYTVQVRMLGYVKTSTTVTVVDGQTTSVEVTLEPSASMLDQVVVTGTVAATAEKAVPTAITVITAAQLERQGITQIDQLFRGEVPGIVAFEQGDQAGDGSVNMLVRGLANFSPYNSPPIKTYVDGVELSNAAYLNDIDPRSIERIEIVRGPQASTVYGADALVGVMQIFTKHGSAMSRPQVTVQLGYGTIQSAYIDGLAPRHDDAVMMTGGTREMTYSLDGIYNFTGQWVPGYTVTNFGTSGGMHRGDGPVTTDLTARFNRRLYSAAAPTQAYAEKAANGTYKYDPRLLRPALGDGTNDNNTLGVKLGYTPASWWQHMLTIGRDEMSYGLIRKQPTYTTPFGADTMASLNTTSSVRTSIAYNTTLAKQSGWLQGTLTAGADYWTLGSLTASTSNTAVVVGPLAAVSATRNHLFNKGFFTQGMLGIADAVFFTAGVRADGSPNFGGKFGGYTYKPRVGVSYAGGFSNVSFKLRSSYGRAIRLPDITYKTGQVLSTSVIRIPNDSIGPETQGGNDYGIELYYGATANVSITYYDQTVKDLINLVTLDPGPPNISQWQNIGDVWSHGWEMQGGVSAGPLRLDGTYTIMNSIVTRADPNSAAGLVKGDKFNFVAKNSGAIGVTYTSRGTTVNLREMIQGPSMGVDYFTYSNFDKDRLYRRVFPSPNVQLFRRLQPGTNLYHLNVTHDVNRELQALFRVENITGERPGGAYLSGANVEGRKTLFGVRFKL